MAPLRALVLDNDQRFDNQAYKNEIKKLVSQNTTLSKSNTIYRNLNQENL